MKTGKISGLCIALMLSACSDDTDKTADVIDSAPAAEVVLNPSSEVYTSWDEFYSKHDISFAIDSFLRSDTVTGELFTQSFTPDDSFYMRYGKLLVFNSDSTLFIDPYSTGWMMELAKDGRVHAREGDADQEVTIVNTKTKVRTRLLFCGPGCQVQRAFWYNDEVVGVMGLMAEYADEYYTPTIWFVNINNGLTIPYQYNSSVSIIHAHDYMKRYMEAKGIVVD